MKTHYILCAAILFPQLALAISSSNPPSGNVQASSFGTVQATLDYCARVNPGASAKYQQEASLIVGGQFKTTNEYKDGYARMQDALGKVPEHVGRQACVDFLDPVRIGDAGHESDEKSEKHDGKSEKDSDHDGQKH
jgi:hypothetical protein